VLFIILFAKTPTIANTQYIYCLLDKSKETKNISELSAFEALCGIAKTASIIEGKMQSEVRFGAVCCAAYH